MSWLSSVRITFQKEIRRGNGGSRYLCERRADVTGKFLPQKLLLKRLQADGTYKDERDADGGVTSKLGFRIIMEDDGQIRIINAATGHRYVRPLEAEAAAMQASEATERARQLEEELARLREIIEKQQKKNGSP